MYNLTSGMTGSGHGYGSESDKGVKMRELTNKELHELLVRCWMTHDGTWFMSCAGEYGVEAANRLNRSAINRTLRDKPRQ